VSTLVGRVLAADEAVALELAVQRGGADVELGSGVGLVPAIQLQRRIKTGG
jgi:hypothetical protein